MISFVTRRLMLGREEALDIIVPIPDEVSQLFLSENLRSHSDLCRSNSLLFQRTFLTSSELTEYLDSKAKINSQYALQFLKKLYSFSLSGSLSDINFSAATYLQFRVDCKDELE